jgi:hypothetical protein
MSWVFFVTSISSLIHARAQNRVTLPAGCWKGFDHEAFRQALHEEIGSLWSPLQIGNRKLKTESPSF